MLVVINWKAAEPQIAGGYSNILEMSCFGLNPVFTYVSFPGHYWMFFTWGTSLDSQFLEWQSAEKFNTGKQDGV